MRFDVSILGDEALRRDLEQLGDKASDMKPAFWAVLRSVLVPRLRARFSGSGWEPLSESTVEWKNRRNLDPRIMRATGALESALTASGKASGRLQTVGKSTVRVGAGKKLFYARFHQFGTDKMPKRELFGWEQSDRSRALRILDSYLFRGVGGFR